MAGARRRRQRCTPSRRRPRSSRRPRAPPCPPSWLQSRRPRDPDHRSRHIVGRRRRLHHRLPQVHVHGRQRDLQHRMAVAGIAAAVAYMVRRRRGATEIALGSSPSAPNRPVAGSALISATFSFAICVRPISYGSVAVDSFLWVTVKLRPARLHVL